MALHAFDLAFMIIFYHYIIIFTNLYFRMIYAARYTPQGAGYLTLVAAAKCPKAVA